MRAGGEYGKRKSNHKGVLEGNRKTAKGKEKNGMKGMRNRYFILPG
jgi:hypothetical protein